MAIAWKELYSQLAFGAKEKKEILSASFELTPRCNLQCKMCYVSHSSNDKQVKAMELTTEQWIHLAEEARDAGLLFVTLTGGEVFIREDFRIIYEKFMSLGFIIKIFTNGTLITPDIVNWLATMPPSVVSITLYGASRETYQKVTGYADGYDKTVRAIDDLLAKGISTEIKTTVIKGNMHEFDQLLDFARQRGLTLGIVNYVSPNREGCNSDPVGNRLTPMELLEYEMHLEKRVQQLASENTASISEINDAVSEEIISSKIKVALKNDDSNSTRPFTCMSGLCAAWVTWDGRLLLCGILDVPFTSAIGKGFLAAWEELKLKCTFIPVCKECQGCQYQSFCEHCPARLYKETGHYDRPSPYLCELARRRKEAKNRSKI